MSVCPEFHADFVNFAHRTPTQRPWRFDLDLAEGTEDVAYFWRALKRRGEQDESRHHTAPGADTGLI